MNFIYILEDFHLIICYGSNNYTLNIYDLLSHDKIASEELQGENECGGFCLSNIVIPLNEYDYSILHRQYIDNFVKINKYNIYTKYIIKIQI